MIEVNNENNAAINEAEMVQCQFTSSIKRAEASAAKKTWQNVLMQRKAAASQNAFVFKYFITFSFWLYYNTYNLNVLPLVGTEDAASEFVIDVPDIFVE